MRPDLPPIWLGAFLLAGWKLSEWAPIVVVDWPIASVVGWALGGGAILLALWAALWFWRARTSIIPGQEADQLITSGPYRLSRNPIYLADVLILIAQGLILGSIWPLAFVPVFVWVLERRFILPEEAMLRRRFPGAFADWSSKVRRWI